MRLASMLSGVSGSLWYLPPLVMSVMVTSQAAHAADCSGSITESTWVECEATFDSSGKPSLTDNTEPDYRSFSTMEATDDGRIIYWGGGHGGYGGNDMDVYHVAADQWRQETEEENWKDRLDACWAQNPSPPSGHRCEDPNDPARTAHLGQTWSVGGSQPTAAEVRRVYGSGPVADYLTGRGRPGTRHVYQQMTWWPDKGWFVFDFKHSLWAWDPDQGDDDDAFMKIFDGKTNQGFADIHYWNVAYDPDSGTLVSFNTKSDAAYLLKNGSWEKVVDVPFNDVGETFSEFHVADGVHYVASGNDLHIVNLKTGATRDIPDSPPDRAGNNASWYEYSPSREQMLVMGHDGNGRLGLWGFNAGTDTWERISMSGTVIRTDGNEITSQDIRWDLLERDPVSGKFYFLAIEKGAEGQAPSMYAFRLPGSTGGSAPADPSPHPTNQWVSLPIPDQPTGLPKGTGKDFQMEWRSADGKVYICCGDWLQNDGVKHAGNEHLLALDAETNTWSVEMDHCSGEQQPEGWDEVAVAYDSKRDELWGFPGFGWTTDDCASDIPSETMAYNFGNKGWRITGHGLLYPSDDTGFGDYDPISDRFYVAERPGVDVIDPTDPAAGITVQHSNGVDYHVSTNQAFLDVQGRGFYLTASQKNRLVRFDLETHFFDEVTEIPSGTVNTNAYAVWDPNHRVILAPVGKQDSRTGDVHVYHVDTGQWQVIEFPHDGQTPFGNSVGYDTDSHLLLQLGTKKYPELKYVYALEYKPYTTGALESWVKTSSGPDIKGKALFMLTDGGGGSTSDGSGGDSGSTDGSTDDGSTDGSTDGGGSSSDGSVADSYEVMNSATETRSSPSALGGQQVSGDIYVFVSPETGVSRVRFYLDDVGMTGTPIQTEENGPFDLAGTRSDDTAIPFDTTTLSDGDHTLTVQISLSDGTTRTLDAMFTVSNTASSSGGSGSDSSGDGSGGGGGGGTTADTTPPVISVPGAATVAAQGRLTDLRRADLGRVTASDDVDGSVTPRLVEPVVASGRHTVTWAATDAAGNRATATQTVNVLPRVSFGVDQTVGEGGQVSVAVRLNGRPPAYPVEIPYTVSGSAQGGDHGATDGTLTLTSPQRSGEIRFSVAGDGTTGEPDETVELALDAGGLKNAVAGVRPRHTVTITEANLAPVLDLVPEQAGERGRWTIVPGQGPVTVTASVSDPNPGDAHTISWPATDNRLVEQDDGDSATFRFDPAGLEPGVYRLRARAAEQRSDGLAPKASTTELALVVVADTPSLSASRDTDGDGASDSAEGLADTDGDGIPDFRDAIADPTMLALDAARRMTVQPGLRLAVGHTAKRHAGSGLDGPVIAPSDLDESDAGFALVHGYFDFRISGLGAPGASARVVIPLPAGRSLPAGARYRKLVPADTRLLVGLSGAIERVWKDFVTVGGDALASAPRTPAGDCPAPDAGAYTDGLSAGHGCVRLQLVDGGPNDADGQANGRIHDPGGLVEQAAGASGSGAGDSGGGAAGRLVPVLALLAAGRLIATRRRRHLGNL